MCHTSGTVSDVPACDSRVVFVVTHVSHDVKTFVLIVSDDELEYLVNSSSFYPVSFVPTYCSVICSLYVPLVRFLRLLVACNKIFFLLLLITLLCSKKRSRWSKMGE